MKYCPTCQTQFEGDETFCPHDGTRLEEGAQPSPGRLTGSSLQNTVNLEGFLYSDHLGERYRGRLLADNTEVRVTVCHRSFDTDSIDKARQIVDGLPSPMPAETLSVHTVQQDSEFLYFIEESADTETLARLLKKKGPLPWRQALHLTVKAGRSLTWLADQGVPHRTLHSRSIFVDNPEASTVQLGEWCLGLITFPPPPVDDDTPATAVPVYPGFLAPEWLVADDVDLQRSVVYSMGAILCTALGAPLFDDDTLENQSFLDWLGDETTPSTELPSLGDDAPEHLVDLIDMMVAPSPEKRFQTPKAALVALSSLLDSTPDEVAPSLGSRDEAPFSVSRQTRPVPLPDHEEDAEAPDSAVRDKRQTVTGLPSQDPTDDEEKSLSHDTNIGHIPRIIISAPDADESDDAMPRQGATTAEFKTSETDDSDEASDSGDEGEQDQPKRKQTLMMGSVSVEDEPEDSDEDKQTETDEPATQEEDPAGDPDDADEAETESGKDLDDTVQHYILDTPKDGAKKEKPADTDDGDDLKSDQKETARETPSSIIVDTAGEESDDQTKDDEDDQKTPASVIVDADLPAESEPSDDADETEDDEEVGEDDQIEEEEEAEPASKPAVRTPADAIGGDQSSDDISIGFVKARQSGGDDFADPWFSRSTEDAWEQDFVREAHERSRRIEKWTRIGMIVGGITIVVAAAILFQGVYAPEEEEEREAVILTSDEQPEELDEAELANLQDRFDRAMERERLIRPRDQSALMALKDLERYADEAVYEEARQRFVEAADELSRLHEEQGTLLAARDLSGYASSNAPDDEELRERAQRVQEKFVQSQEEEASRDEELAADESDGEENQEDDPSSADGAESEEVASAADSAPAPTPSGGSGIDIDDLIAQAQAAEEAREPGRAREKYTTILEHAPNHARANAGLGELYFHDGSYDEAINYQRRAVDAAPNNVTYRLRLGMSHHRLQQYGDAIAIWEEVLEIDPGNARAELYIDRAQQRMN